jgi:hypothetical protein
VAQRLGRSGRCPGVNYGYVSKRVKLCLTFNAKVGDCLRQEIGFPTGKAVKVACGSSATYRGARVVPGVADEALCGRGAVRNDLDRPPAMVYPEPPLTICTDAA